MHFFGIFVPRTAFLCRVGHGGGEQEEVWLDSEINKRRGAKGERERDEKRQDERHKVEEKRPPHRLLTSPFVASFMWTTKIALSIDRGGDIADFFVVKSPATFHHPRVHPTPPESFLLAQCHIIVAIHTTNRAV